MSARYLRPAMPTWGRDVGETRVVLRKVEVKKFGAGSSVEEMEKEKGERWGVVSGGWCEGWRVGGGVQEGGTGGGGEGRGFLIKINDQGVEIAEKKKKK